MDWQLKQDYARSLSEDQLKRLFGETEQSDELVVQISDPDLY
jgi:hypothetical protein